MICCEVIPALGLQARSYPRYGAAIASPGALARVLPRLDGERSAPQEALANAARHGRGAGSTTVELRVDDGAVRVEVRNPAAARPQASSKGSGLVGMEERVAAVGGTVQAGPQNGQWVVDARIPVKAGSLEAEP